MAEDIDFAMRLCIFVHHLRNYEKYKDILESGSFDPEEGNFVVSDNYFEKENRLEVFQVLSSTLLGKESVCTSHKLAPVLVEHYGLTKQHFETKHFRMSEKEFCRTRRRNHE